MGNSFFSQAMLAMALLLSPGCHAAPVKRGGGPSFDFGSEKVRGVNLGGWFVLEPWITPSIFEALPDDVVDQYTMSSHLGKSGMQDQMEKHWSSWITEDDFHEMASYGLNFVRIPIGYWSIIPLPNDPYETGAYEWLEKAVGWAESAGLKVLIDLHGAPLSQNGFDNSGRKGPVDWTDGDTTEHTMQVLAKIKQDHASNPTVAAIEMVNEPVASEVGLNAVTQFYNGGYDVLKDSGVAITIHDAFEGVDAWNDWNAGAPSVMVDTHHYELFDQTMQEMSLDDHIGTAYAFGDQMASNSKWTVAGEWCGAMTDCTKWLNGKGTGARYDGTFPDSYYIGSCDGKVTGTVAGLSEDDKSNLAQYIQAQINAFEKAAGWFWWTWKTESSPEWDFQALAQAGIMPKLG